MYLVDLSSVSFILIDVPICPRLAAGHFFNVASIMAAFLNLVKGDQLLPMPSGWLPTIQVAFQQSLQIKGAQQQIPQHGSSRGGKAGLLSMLLPGKTPQSPL